MLFGSTRVFVHRASTDVAATSYTKAATTERTTARTVRIELWFGPGGEAFPTGVLCKTVVFLGWSALKAVETRQR